MRVTYKHWKTSKELMCEGSIIKNSPDSDRIVIKKEDNSYEDILKNTIIRIENNET